MTRILLALKRWALRGWMVPAFGLLGLIAAGAMVISTPSTYLATTTLFIGSPASADSAGALQGDSFSQQRAVTYAQLIKTESIAVKVKDDLGLAVTPQELSAAVTATTVEKTVLLNVSVKGDTPQIAADIANAYADNFARYVGQLETPNGGGAPSALVSVVSTADPSQAVKAVDSTMNLLMGLVGGLALGGGLWWLLRRLDKTIRSVAGLADAAHAPVIGMFPTFESGVAVDFDASAGGSVVESARKLRTNVEFMDVDNPNRTLVVASPTAGEGAEEVAVLLSLSLGEAKRKVVLVDADFRSAPLAAYFGVDGRPGVADVLTEDIQVQNVEIALPDRHISVVPAGAGSGERVDDLASNAMTDVLADLSSRYEYVVVLAPPILSFADCASLAARLDGVLIVTKREHGSADTVARSASLLRSAGSTVLGAVLTAAKVSATTARTVRLVTPPVVRDGGSKPASVDQAHGHDEPNSGEFVDDVEGVKGHWPPVVRVKSAEVPLPRREVTTTVERGSVADSEESSIDTEGKATDAGHISLEDDDLTDWAPAVSEDRYTRSDIDPPTIAIRRDELPKAVEKSAKPSEPASRTKLSKQAPSGS